jgi:hypothetical protein
MEQRSEVGQALNKLQAVREQNSRLALMSKPVPIKKGGFLGWLQKRACPRVGECCSAMTNNPAPRAGISRVSETAYLAVNLV